MRLAAQVRRRSRDAGRARRQARALPQPGADGAQRRHDPVRQPDAAVLPPGARRPRGGRDAGDRRVDPRRLVFALKEAVGRGGDPPARARLRPPRAGVLGRNPRIEILGNPEPSASRSSRSACATRAGCCTRTSSSPCSATCSASRRAAAASAPGPTSTACTRSTSSGRGAWTHEVTRGHLGAKLAFTALSFNYFISDTVFDYILDAVHLRRRRRLEAAAALPLRSRLGPVAPRPRPRPDAARG